MRWRKVFRAVHRDLGYVAVALTIAYALSGIAVNHIEDWNPNYAMSTARVDIGAFAQPDLHAMETYVVGKLALGRVRGHFLESATDFRIYLDEGQEARLDPTTGKGTVKRLSKRAVFFEVNALHLNNLKGAWTYVADVFALALMVLAITGTVMMKGDRGLAGRGKYFLAAGFAIPIAFIIYLYSA